MLQILKHNNLQKKILEKWAYNASPPSNNKANLDCLQKQADILDISKMSAFYALINLLISPI